MAAKCEDFLVKEATGERPGEENQQIWGEGLAVAIHVLLPLAIAGVLWGRKIILSKILLHLDKACLSVFWPSFSKREKVLKWTLTHLPYLEGGLETIWNDGSQLCTLINSVVPGACPNPHRHWKKPPTHGQALAYKYLGVVPVFTDSDFNQKSMNSTIEKTLIEYMTNVQNAVSKISHDEELTFSNNYIARGMGLVTGEQYRKTVLYIYPNNKNKQSDNLLINIRGPYNSHGVSILYASDLAALYKTIRTSERKRMISEEEQKSFLKNLTGDFQNLLSIKYNREQSCDIDISIEIERNRAKVMFIPRNSGVYEVCLTTNGEHIAGSPYNINVEKNRSGIMDDLSEDECKGKSKKRIIPKIIETPPPDNKHAYIKYEEKDKWKKMRKIRSLGHSSDSSNNTSVEEDICYLTIKKDEDLNNNNNEMADNLNETLNEATLEVEVELPMKQVLLSDLDKLKFPNVDGEKTDVKEGKITTVKSQDIRDRIAALENSVNENKNEKPKVSPARKKANLTLIINPPVTLDDNNNNSISEEVKKIKDNSCALKKIDAFQKIIDSNKPETLKKISGEGSGKPKSNPVRKLSETNIGPAESKLPGITSDNAKTEEIGLNKEDSSSKSSDLIHITPSAKVESATTETSFAAGVLENEIDEAVKLSSLESNDSIYTHSINDDDDAKIMKSLSRSEGIQLNRHEIDEIPTETKNCEENSVPDKVILGNGDSVKFEQSEGNLGDVNNNAVSLKSEIIDDSENNGDETKNKHSLESVFIGDYHKNGRSEKTIDSSSLSEANSDKVDECHLVTESSAEIVEKNVASEANSTKASLISKTNLSKVLEHSSTPEIESMKALGDSLTSETNYTKPPGHSLITETKSTKALGNSLITEAKSTKTDPLTSENKSTNSLRDHLTSETNSVKAIGYTDMNSAEDFGYSSASLETIGQSLEESPTTNDYTMTTVIQKGKDLKESQSNTSDDELMIEVSKRGSVFADGIKKRDSEFLNGIPQGSSVEKRIQRLANLERASDANRESFLKLKMFTKRNKIDGNGERTQVDCDSGEKRQSVSKISDEEKDKGAYKNLLFNKEKYNKIESNIGDLKSPLVMRSVVNGSASSLIKDCVFDVNPVKKPIRLETAARKEAAVLNNSPSKANQFPQSLKYEKPDLSAAAPLEEPASPVSRNTAPEDLPSNPKIRVSDVSTENIKETQNGKGKLLRKWKTVDEPDGTMAEDENLDLRLSFMKRKEFWSKISTASTTSLNSSCLSLNFDHADRRYSSLSRLQVKKPKLESCNLREIRASNPKQFRSLDFIDKRRIHRSDSYGIRDRYGSLDDLYFPSVKERRGLFLKEMIQDEARNVANVEKQVKPATRQLMRKLEEKASPSVVKSQEVLMGRRTKNLFGSIHDKIKLFDSGFNPEKKSIKSQETSDSNEVLKETWERKLNQLPENGTIKTKIKERFEKAQIFFKTLENVKQQKREDNLRTCLARRHSWGSNTVKLEVIKTGGSLRNLSISERLPLNTLSKYHRDGVESSDSLFDSFSSNGDGKCVDYEELKKLQMNLFLLNNNKKKERKSVHNVFN